MVLRIAGIEFISQRTGVAFSVQNVTAASHGITSAGQCSKPTHIQVVIDFIHIVDLLLDKVFHNEATLADWLQLEARPMKSVASSSERYSATAKASAISSVPTRSSWSRTTGQFPQTPPAIRHAGYRQDYFQRRKIPEAVCSAFRYKPLPGSFAQTVWHTARFLLFQHRQSLHLFSGRDSIVNADKYRANSYHNKIVVTQRSFYHSRLRSFSLSGHLKSGPIDLGHHNKQPHHRADDTHPAHVIP